MSETKKTLDGARERKNDEFYTRPEDAKRGIFAVAEYLRGKTVYCPCDNPIKSNFVKCLISYFHELELKAVWATWLGGGSLFRFDGGTLHDFIPLIGDSLLGEDGRFESVACKKIMAQCDIVITNPPFSLLREFYSQVRSFEKDFLIIAPVLSIGYSPIIPDALKGKYNFVSGVEWFYLPNGTATHVDCGLFSSFKTNLLPFYYTGKKYNDRYYNRFINYDGINVDSIKDIPDDYNGAMGVPTYFIKYLNKNQFDLIGIRKGDDGNDLAIHAEKGRKELFTRLLIKRKKF